MSQDSTWRHLCAQSFVAGKIRTPDAKNPPAACILPSDSIRTAIFGKHDLNTHNSCYLNVNTLTLTIFRGGNIVQLPRLLRRITCFWGRVATINIPPQSSAFVTHMFCFQRFVSWPTSECLQSIRPQIGMPLRAQSAFLSLS
jgi:hypothetical protein